MEELIKSFQQLFSQPTFIEGISLGHLTALILGILVVIGAIVTVRTLGQLGGCVLRFGCLIVMLFMFAAIVSILILSGLPK
ncbi:MAG: hypothetical protein KF716_14820 [Anaerolineae bacterium]|nr:hypothetical protein [Anaerolineae bacterium]